MLISSINIMAMHTVVSLNNILVLKFNIIEPILRSVLHLIYNLNQSKIRDIINLKMQWTKPQYMSIE